MFILLVVLFLVVIVLGVKARTNPGLRVPVAVLALVSAALAVGHLLTFAPEKHLPVDSHPEEALGFVLAKRVQEDFPDGGKVIVFRPETDEERLLAIFTARMEGIRRVLRDEFEIVLRGPLLRYGSLDDRQAWFQMETGFPLTSFQQWVAEDGDAVAAISMLGMPVGGLGGGKTGLPPLYVAELRGVPWDPNRLPPGIATVVTYRNDRELDPERTRKLLSVFEQNFTLYPPPPDNTDDADAGDDPNGD